MDYSDRKNKIMDHNSLFELSAQWKEQGRTIVYCHGHFNIVHPGHLRFLEFAKEHGDILVVAVTTDSSLSPQVQNHFFNEDERANNVASVSFVDMVIKIDSIDNLKILDSIKPDYYVKGSEHKYSNGIAGKNKEKELAKSIGCKIIYGSGSLKYSTAELLHDSIEKIKQNEIKQFQDACRRQKVVFEDLQEIVRRFQDKKFLVIGDTIVDQYIACDPLGMSSESPVLVLNEIEKKEYLGGAGVVARHVKALGANCSFITVVGKDDSADFVKKELEDSGISHTLLTDESRPTTFKIRYMVGQQKILRVSRLKDHEIDNALENQIVQQLKKNAAGFDGVIICDFGYGIVTKSLFKKIKVIADEYNIPVFCDAQCSSQISDLSKFTSVELITPTEREARITLANKNSGLQHLGMELLEKTGNKYVVITLNSNGMIAFKKRVFGQEVNIDSQHFPALVANPVDVAGAGDSLLSAASLSLACGANIMEASVIGSCVAALAVNKLGNIPISFEELDQYFETTIKEIINN